MDDVRLIVGLGNPGERYLRTRHNAGFLAVERIGDRWRADPWKTESRFRAKLARVERGASRFILCEPQTYMNASGPAVESVRAFFKAPVSQLLILVDDADLDFGKVRLRGEGSPGGHHGLESVERSLGTRNYARLRIGIGRRSADQREITNWVLGRFQDDEIPVLNRTLDHVAEQVDCWATEGVAAAMNRFNGAVPEGASIGDE